jgi:hypothetical protein
VLAVIQSVPEGLHLPRFILLTLCVCMMVVAQDRTATGFVYPQSSNVGSYASFLDSSCGSDSNYLADMFHIGKDVQGNQSQPVYAIADGEVVYVSPHGWIYNNPTAAGDGITTNIGLLIKHQTASGFWFHAVYGHILSSLKAGNQVRAGQQIGTIGFWQPTHIHFGVRVPLSSDAGSGDLPVHFGNAICSEWPLPASDRWIDPIQFIQTQRPNNFLGNGGGTVSPQINDINPKTVSVGTANTFTLSGTGFLPGFTAKLWVGNNSFAVDPSQTNFMNQNQVQVTVGVGATRDPTTSFCLQVANSGAASNEYCGLTAQAGAGGATLPNLQISFTPNPVPRSSDGNWYYSVTVTETNGASVSLTSLSFAGNDYSQRIASWFGSNQIGAHGQISQNFSTSGSPGNWPWTFSGNGQTWSQNVTLQP